MVTTTPLRGIAQVKWPTAGAAISGLSAMLSSPSWITTQHWGAALGD